MLIFIISVAVPDLVVKIWQKIDFVQIVPRGKIARRFMSIWAKAAAHR